VISAVSISVTSTLLTVILSYFFDRPTLKLEMLSFTVLRLFASAYLASASCYVIKLESLVSWLTFVGTVGSSVFKAKSDIGLNVPSEVAKQLLYLSEVIPLIEYVVRMACPSYIF